MDEVVKNRRLPKSLEDELKRIAEQPSWKSDNEGIHERVNFDDTIWGFNLAGGAYYNTPLRVTHVKSDSRAEKAGIQVGDTLKMINGIETNTLTIQEAHDLILSSGIEIKLGFTAPDVDEATHSVYQDEIDDEEAKRRLLKEMEEFARKYRIKGAKADDAWSLAWPCKKRREIMYRESNCFLVPSAYEKKHPEKILKNRTTEEGALNYLGQQETI